MFDNLQIAIPSRSRAHLQKTIYNLSQRLWPIVTIVVPVEQHSDYRRKIPEEISVLPSETFGIGPTRQFILKTRTTGKLIMLDDDLTFYRRNDSGNKFYIIAGDNTEQMITDIVDFLDRYPMVGVADKFMSHTQPRGYKECSRFNDMHGYNRDLLPVPWPEFRVLAEEDHDFHLQLLTRGYKTAVITEYSKTNKAQSAGGCSDWRNTETMLKVQQQMLEYWPGIVSLTPKPNYVTENRVRYNWKKAKRIGGLLS
jgi:hypothetical protein